MDKGVQMPFGTPYRNVPCPKNAFSAATVWPARQSHVKLASSATPWASETGCVGAMVTALMAMRGIDLVAATTILAEVGDLGRLHFRTRPSRPHLSLRHQTAYHRAWLSAGSHAPPFAAPSQDPRHWSDRW